jgi:hypothetical protein
VIHLISTLYLPSFSKIFLLCTPIWNTLIIVWILILVLGYIFFYSLCFGFFFNPVLCLLCIMFWVSVLSECSEVNDSLSINRKADRVYC